MAIQLSDDVRARLDAHLDAVEKALVAAGSSRERRRGVVDDLEAQILDMLAAQTQVPTVGDLEGVLARLDPPAAYGEAMPAMPKVPPAAPDVPQGQSREWWGVIKAFGAVTVLLLMILCVMGFMFFFIRRVGGH